MSVSSSDQTDPELYAQETQRRQQPGFAELRRPGYLWTWFWSFVEGWFLSRNYRQLAIGLPFLVIAIGGPMFVWWLKSAPRDGLIAAYEVAVDNSIRNEQPERTGLYLESLVDLRPLRRDYRHQLAMHYMQQEQPEKAAEHLPILIGEDGHVPTRMWLVQQAADDDPDFPLSDEQIDSQLNKILEKQPANLIANWRMAERLIQKQQFRTAEDYLQKIVGRTPALGLPLAQVQIRLQRDQKQILAHLEMADEFFQKALLTNTKDSESRVRRAEIMMLKNDFAGAAELIAEGRQAEDNQQLREFQAQLLVTEASRKLAESALNAPAAARNLVQAMQLNPADASLLQLALSLNQLGVKWTPDQLQPALDALLRKSDPTDADRRLLLAGLSATGQNQKALELIEELERPGLSERITRAEFLLRNGEQEKGGSLLTQMLAETEGDDSLNVSMERVRVLLLLNRNTDALTLLDQIQNRFDVAEQQQVAAWQAYFTRATLEVFSQRLENDDFQDAAAAIQMLMDPRQGSVSVFSVVQRMLALANVRSDLEPEIREKLIELARKNRSGWQIYNMLGTYDLQKAEQDPVRLAAALKSLELAYQSNKQDPMLMNNLAIALVRNDRDLVRARELVEEAIGKLANPVDALSTRAEISVAEERWEEALADLETALAQRPNSANVRRLLVQVLTVLDKPDLAAEHQEVYQQLTTPVDARLPSGEPESE